ncbi:MAG: hypothetical protein ACRDPR_07000 [Nocardioidaceae bacterium]
MDDLMGVPPESTWVDIDLDEDGRTTLHLVHRDLPPDSAELHHDGWDHFLTPFARRLSAH